MKQLIRFFLLFIGFLFHHNKRSKVIYYHDVSKKYTDMGTPLSLIKTHIDVARKAGFKLVDNIYTAEGQIMICFDDGWKGIYENKEFFIKMKVFPTIFIAVELIGTDGYMSIQQIKELIELGYHFESHAWTHTGLHTYTGNDLKHELLDSRKWLENTFNKQFDAICFPQGNYNDEVIRESKAAGYNRLYSSINGGYEDLMKFDGLICRNLVQDVTELQFKFIIKGDSPIIRNKRIKQHYYQS